MIRSINSGKLAGLSAAKSAYVREQVLAPRSPAKVGPRPGKARPNSGTLVPCTGKSAPSNEEEAWLSPVATRCPGVPATARVGRRKWQRGHGLHGPPVRAAQGAIHRRFLERLNLPTDKTERDTVIEAIPPVGTSCSSKKPAQFRRARAWWDRFSMAWVGTHRADEGPGGLGHPGEHLEADHH